MEEHKILVLSSLCVQKLNSKKVNSTFKQIKNFHHLFSIMFRIWLACVFVSLKMPLRLLSTWLQYFGHYIFRMIENWGIQGLYLVFSGGGIDFL